jgi:hypothetical protein
MSDDLLVRMRYHSATLDRPLFMEAAARIEALEAALKDATRILEQAQCCIMQETPEDMTFGEAEDDTLSKIRAFLNRAALDKDAGQ